MAKMAKANPKYSKAVTTNRSILSSPAPSKSSLRSTKSAPANNEKTWSVISLFSGCGGLDLGFRGGFKYNGIQHRKLPYEILAAYDHDPRCVSTYNLNITDHAHVLDLSTYEPERLPTAEIAIGGFPCQDFATCGPRRGLDSERGRLYKALIRYARHHRPMTIIGENVPGLENIAGGEALKTIIREMEQIGYIVKVWKMFAPDYGVPQNRTRLFIIGVRKDLAGFPACPKPTHAGRHNNIKWAIEDLKHITDESVPNQSQYFLASKAKKGNGQGDEVSRADEPSYTVRANAKSRVQFHYALERRLTVRECARLQTFPDNFFFPHAATTNIMQIGNAVPPMLGHIVGKAISEWLKSTRV